MRNNDLEKPQRKTAFEELFNEDLFGETISKENMVPSPVVRSAPSKKMPMQAPPKMEAPLKMKYQPLQRDGLKHSYRQTDRKGQTVKLVNIQEEGPRNSQMKKVILNDFSLKKAVIYSEILQRKY